MIRSLVEMYVGRVLVHVMVELSYLFLCLLSKISGFSGFGINSDMFILPWLHVIVLNFSWIEQMRSLLECLN